LRPGACPTKSYKYWFTHICNYKIFLSYTVYILVGNFLPIFSGHAVYQMAIQCTKLPKNIPHGHEMYQNFPSHVLKICIKIGGITMQINHLATLLKNRHISRLVVIFCHEKLQLVLSRALLFLPKIENNGPMLWIETIEI
jgi:hypothetical protein